jgi:hypothetical protein
MHYFTGILSISDTGILLKNKQLQHNILYSFIY